MNEGRKGRVRSFRPEHRLKKSNDFKAIRVTGRSKGYRNLVFCWRTQEGISRLGLSVGRRAGNAIDRNHFKRQIREWFRHSKSELRNIDLHVIVRTHAKAVEMSREARIEGMRYEMGKFLQSSRPS